MPAYAHCRICERAFRIIPECKWHRVRTCCKEHYEAIVGRRQGYPSRIEAAKAQAERAANDELRDLAGIAARKAEIDAMRPPIVVVPDEPEAEKAVRATCGDAVGAGVGVGAVREYHGSARRGKMLTGCLMLAAVLGLCGQALAITPPPEPIRERCDVIEVNSFYDDSGRLVFDQVIFYDWSPDDCRYQVRAWRLVKRPSQIAAWDWQRGEWVATWSDGEYGDGALRVVSAQSFRRTWTQYDPELVERETLPKERRRELSQWRVNK